MNTTNSRKKIAIFLLFGLFLIGIPATVYVAQRQQETRGRAAVVAENTVIVVVDGVSYKKSDIRKVAEEQNDPSVVDLKALQVAQRILEERKILDKASRDLGIQLDSARVQKLVSLGYGENEAKYDVLRDQVILSAVRSRQALSIEFWNPPADSLSTLTAEEKTAAANQLRDGIPALGEADTAMRAGDQVADIASSLLTKYPSLKPVLGVNGTIFDGLASDEKEEIKEPEIYEFGDSNLDKATRDGLFAMGIDEVKKITDTQDNRGGTVFELVAKGKDSGEASYDTWFTKQKTALVRQVSSL